VALLLGPFWAPMVAILIILGPLCVQTLLRTPTTCGLIWSPRGCPDSATREAPCGWHCQRPWRPRRSYRTQDYRKLQRASSAHNRVDLLGSGTIRPSGTIWYDPVRFFIFHYFLPVRSGRKRYDPVRFGTIWYDPVLDRTRS